MRVNVIRIGNSRGIRIPKPLLAQCHIGDAVELEVRKDHLAVVPADSPRSGWTDAFRKMAAHGDDAMLDEEAPTQWDRTEWKW